MTKIVATKIHYDHRRGLPRHLKYSKFLTKSEHDYFLRLYREESVGGDGFFECLNFNKNDSDNEVKIYLPPGYIPKEEVCKKRILLFSFTYKGDKKFPASVVGVHGGVKILSRDQGGIPRKNIDGGVAGLLYHAVAPINMTTLFSTPLKYDFSAGMYTPPYSAWGNGLRYLEDKHAKNILNQALDESIRLCKKETNKAKINFIEEEIKVIVNILSEILGENPKKNMFKPSFMAPYLGRPDKEIGFLGEEYVYNQELKYAEEHGIDKANIEWLSQAVPSSVCDIKTVRIEGGELINHYLEVKSTKMADFNNVYISSSQIEFFEDNPSSSTFVFVKFNNSKELVEKKSLSLDELKKEFNLKAIKYKISKK